MNRGYMLIVVLMCAFASHAQDSAVKAKGKSGKFVGVVSYEAPGVERDEVVAVKPVVANDRTPKAFMDLTENELEERLYHINEKLKTVTEVEGDAEQISFYKQQVEAITQRLESIKNKKQ